MTPVSDQPATRTEFPGLSADEQVELDALRAGDATAFAALVRRHHLSMTRVAQGYLPSRETAAEAVQDTWLAVIQNLDRFEGRSSLRTWIFRILTNRAMTLGPRERRSVPFSSLAAAEAGDSEPAVEQDRFLGTAAAWAGWWDDPPRSFPRTPEGRVLSREVLDVVDSSIAALRPAQRAVITLRDVEGWSAAEVCTALEITEGNQRVLLHRARSAVRSALERYYDPS